MAMNDPGAMGASPADARPKTFRGEDRERWDREFAFIRKQVEAGDPFALTDSLLADFLYFEAAMHAEERRLVADPLLWTDEDLALGRWIEASYYTMARSAARVMARLLAREKVTDADRLLCARLGAVSLAASGSSIKWTQIADAGRRPMLLKEAQAVLTMAEEKALAGLPCEVPVHGEKVGTTLAPLFVRVVLLDALCHGNLRRQPLGAVDCWLWEWISDYPLVEQASGAQVRTGLAPPLGGGQTRVVSLDAMAAHLDTVTGWFREGRIYPGHGVAADLRVEDHVAALDTLRAFLAASRQKGGARQERENRMSAVEVLVGLPEILDKGFQVGAMADEDERAAPAPSFEGGLPFNIGNHYQATVRLMDLMDESPGGIGLEFDDAATPLEGGTLLGVRVNPAQPVVVCEVVRRVASPGRRSRLGTRVLLGEKRVIRLTSAKWPTGIDAIYLAGEDPSGRGDGLIVSATACDTTIVHEAELPGRRFRLRISRVRRRGHGWALAAIEFLDDAAPV
jgi:hypothetical protein